MGAAALRDEIPRPVIPVRECSALRRATGGGIGHGPAPADGGRAVARAQEALASALSGVLSAPSAPSA